MYYIVQNVQYLIYLHNSYDFPMKVKILRVTSGVLADASIKGRSIKLPGLHEGWRFAFDKLIKKLPYATAYVLVSEETPQVIEGCLIFQLKDNLIPYMAFVEVAPHNKRDPKKYDYVAGCLIAFAFKQSLIQGKGDYKGWLSFDVLEEKKEDQLKLMSHYSKKYHAVRADETTMYIMDEQGETLIKEYLE